MLAHEKIHMAGSLCRQYGPGRLPYASRRDLGGGIAMAATAVAATALWYVANLSVLTTGVVADSGNNLRFAVAMSLFVIPVALPAAFVLGTLLWRYGLPDEPTPWLGSLLGAATALGSLAVGVVVGSYLLFGFMVFDGGLAPTATEIVLAPLLFAVMGLLFALIFAAWFIVPIGAFGGWYHERAKRAWR